MLAMYPAVYTVQYKVNMFTVKYIIVQCILYKVDVGAMYPAVYTVQGSFTFVQYTSLLYNIHCTRLTFEQYILQFTIAVH